MMPLEGVWDANGTPEEPESTSDEKPVHSSAATTAASAGSFTGSFATAGEPQPAKRANPPMVRNFT